MFVCISSLTNVKVHFEHMTVGKSLKSFVTATQTGSSGHRYVFLNVRYEYVVVISSENRFWTILVFCKPCCRGGHVRRRIPEAPRGNKLRADRGSHSLSANKWKFSLEINMTQFAIFKTDSSRDICNHITLLTVFDIQPKKVFWWRKHFSQHWKLSCTEKYHIFSLKHQCYWKSTTIAIAKI